MVPGDDDSQNGDGPSWEPTSTRGPSTPGPASDERDPGATRLTEPGEPLGDGPESWSDKLKDKVQHATQSVLATGRTLAEKAATRAKDLFGGLGRKGGDFAEELKTRWRGDADADPDGFGGATGTAGRSRKWNAQEITRSIAKAMPKSIDPAAVAAWGSTQLSKHGAAVYGTAATIVLSTWFLADLTALLLEKYIPEPPPSRGFQSGPRARNRSVDEYAVIFSRNLFNSEGRIPGDDQPGQPTDAGGAPVRTSLPFNLVGTLILRDEIRSIATIEDKSAQMVYPVRREEEIPGKARILAVEARRVVFVNLGSGRREYVELPEDESAPQISLMSKGPAKGPGFGIEKLSPNQFNVARTEVDKALSDLNRVLTEARAVPNFENGQPAGYKLFQIVPGSIYDKLGLQNADVLCGLNGAPINDPGKAFEMLAELKTASRLELCVKRDGKQSNFQYEIR